MARTDHFIFVTRPDQTVTAGAGDRAEGLSSLVVGSDGGALSYFRRLTVE